MQQYISQIAEGAQHVAEEMFHDANDASGEGAKH